MKSKSTDLRLFKYPGGKTRVLETLFSYFPNHHTYIEPFGGSYVVILNKDRCKVELVNDIDPGIEALAYCLLLCPDELLKATKYEVHSQALFNFFKTHDFEKRTMLEKAIRKLYLVYHSYSGLGGSYAYSMNHDRRLLYNSKFTEDSLKRLHDRISNIHLFSEDFRKFLKRFDKTKKGFIYLDPPYITTLKRKNMYSYVFTEKDHQDLYSILKEFDFKKVKWLMSYDKVPFIENLYADFFFTDLEVPYTLMNKSDSPAQIKTELLISNYDISNKYSLNDNSQRQLLEFM